MFLKVTAYLAERLCPSNKEVWKSSYLYCKLCLNYTEALYSLKSVPLDFSNISISSFYVFGIQITSCYASESTHQPDISWSFIPPLSPPTSSPFTPLSEAIATQRITPTWGWTHRRIKRSTLPLHRLPWAMLSNQRKKSDIGNRVKWVSL